MAQERLLDRREFLGGGLAAGVALAARPAAGAAGELPPHRRPGRTFEETGGYGERSKFVDDARLKQSDGTNLYGGGYTPLERGHGIVTPSGLHYEVFHNGCPDIDPQ